MIARRSPGGTASVTPSTADSPPNTLETFESVSAGTGSLMGSAILAGREVAVVDRLLQELLRLVLPELRHGRVRVDDRVPELPVLLLDLADVDVLDRVAVRVELDGAAGRVRDLDVAQRLEELLPVLDVAADGLGGLGYPSRAGVGGLREVRGDLAVLLPVLGHEPLVDRVVQGGAVLEGRHPADGLVAEGRQHELVERGPAADEGELRLEAGVLVLLGEPQRRAGHHQGEDGVRVALDLREVRREVGGVQRGPELLD